MRLVIKKQNGLTKPANCFYNVNKGIKFYAVRDLSKQYAIALDNFDYFLLPV